MERTFKMSLTSGSFFRFSKTPPGSLNSWSTEYYVDDLAQKIRHQVLKMASHKFFFFRLVKMFSVQFKPSNNITNSEAQPLKKHPLKWSHLFFSDFCRSTSIGLLTATYLLSRKIFMGSPQFSILHYTILQMVEILLYLTTSNLLQCKVPVLLQLN